MIPNTLILDTYFSGGTRTPSGLHCIVYCESKNNPVGQERFQKHFEPSTSERSYLLTLTVAKNQKLPITSNQKYLQSFVLFHHLYFFENYIVTVANLKRIMTPYKLMIWCHSFYVVKVGWWALKTSEGMTWVPSNYYEITFMIWKTCPTMPAPHEFQPWQHSSKG